MGYEGKNGGEVVHKFAVHGFFAEHRSAGEGTKSKCS